MSRENKILKVVGEVRSLLTGKEDPDISAILGILAQSVGAERASLCLFPVETGLSGDIDKKELITWSRDGGEFATTGPGSGKSTFGEWLEQRILEGNPVTVDNVDDMPGESSSEKDWLKKSNVKSMAAFPYRSWDTHYLGFIGLYWISRQYKCTEAETELLAMMSEFVATGYGHMKAEKLVRKSESRFRTLIQKSSDIITLLDAEMNILYVSPSITSILGYETTEMTGKNAIDFVHPDDHEQVQEKFRQVLASSMEERIVEHQYRHKQGYWVFLESVGTNLIGDPEVKGVVVNSRDITFRKQTERDLIRARDAAEDMNRVKTALLANMSHEMRTPLTGILGFASILESDLPEGESRDMAKRINVSGRRLLETIESILDLAKLESEKVDIQPEPINIVEEISRALEFHETTAQRKGLELQMRARVKELSVEIDRQLFNRIMYSLLSNALKYTEKGRVTVHISKMQKDQNDYVKVDVEDTGVGISPEFIPKVFDEFQQESSGLSRRYEGSGLGLTITRKLVEILGGVITVESKKGEGSIFSLHVPVQYEKVTSGDDQQERQKSITTQKPRVLVVEDDYDSSTITRFYLGQDYEVKITDSGEKAVDLLRNEEFHLVLMDISLGAGMDGVTTLKTMQKKSLLTEIPVIALTAHALSGDAGYYLKQGFTGYLSKPFKKAELQQLVRKFL